jgi:hypothetical protein
MSRCVISVHNARFLHLLDALYRTQYGKILPQLVFPSTLKCIPVHPPFQDCRLSQFFSDSLTLSHLIHPGVPHFDRRRFCSNDIIFFLPYAIPFGPRRVSQTSVLHTSSPHDHHLMLTFVMNKAKVWSPNLSKSSGGLVVTSLRFPIFLQV